MESRPDPHLRFRFRVAVLILLLFSTGISLPISALKSTAATWSQGETAVFFSIILDILQRPKVMANILTHPDASGNIIRYFEEGNIADSSWWLSNRAGLLTLFSDGDTYTLLGNNPWLFGVLRNVNQSYPAAYTRMLNNRPFFNTVLRQVVAHQEFEIIFTYHPEYLPLIYNLTFNQPFDSAWTRIIHPFTGRPIGNLTAITVFTLSLTAISQTTLTLSHFGKTIMTLAGRGTVIYNATLNAANFTEDPYQLQATVTLTNGLILQDTETLFYSRTIAVTP